jgi:hypothetical protein
MSPLEVNKTHAYEPKRKFQVSWAIKLPWVEFQVGSNGCVHRVKKFAQRLNIKINYWLSNGIHFRDKKKADKLVKGVKKFEL